MVETSTIIVDFNLNNIPENLENSDLRENLEHYKEEIERYGGFHDVIHELHRNCDVDTLEAMTAVEILDDLYDSAMEYIQYLENKIEKLENNSH